MRHWACLLALAALPPTAAADEPKFQVPKTWEKVTTGPAAWSFLTARDGYAVGIEKVIVKGTEHNRAQTFTETVYRFKVGDDKPEQLDRQETTHGTVALLGPGGAVATGWFADCRAVHLPGHKPLPLPRDKVRFAAHHFTAAGLVCTGEMFADKDYVHEVVVFPLDRARGTMDEARVVRAWFPRAAAGGFVPDFNHGRLFLRGDFVAYTGTLPDPAKPGFPRAAIEVWDARNEKVVWHENGAVEAADDTHAYWFPESNVVARRALDGRSKAERLALPKDIVRLDMHPPRLFALAKREKEWVLTLFDLSTGGRAEYGLRVPDGRQLTTGGGAGVAVIATPADPQSGTRIPLGLDAAAGEVRAMFDKTVYKVPVAEKFPAAEKPKWEPLPEPK